MPSCTINYDNKSKGIYYSGQTITGNILFDNEKSRKMSIISLSFEGFAKCKWHKRISKNRTETYRGRQNYVHEQKILLSSPVKDKEMELLKDLHNFPFFFQIQSHFPTSVEAFRDESGWGSSYGFRGYVRYILTFKLVRSWKSDIKYEFPLTIIKNLNLNFIEPRYRVPAMIEDKKDFTFSSKNLHMSVNAAVTAFVCGEKANFLITYNNESSSDVAETHITLVRNNQYNSNEPKCVTKTGSEIITYYNFEGVKAKTAKTIEAYLKIPSVAPTSDGSCRVLVISYEVHFTAIFGGLHSNHTLKLPVVIGTVPFLSPELLPPLTVNDQVPQYPSAPQQETSHPNPPNLRPVSFHRDSIGWNFGASSSTDTMQRPSAPVPTTPEDYDMPPPTYMEATAGSKMDAISEESSSTTNEREGMNFTPSYPVYNLDNPSYRH